MEPFINFSGLMSLLITVKQLQIIHRQLWKEEISLFHPVSDQQYSAMKYGFFPHFSTAPYYLLLLN